MTKRFFSRCSGEPDAGVYAILYAVLVVVLIGMGAIVVDFASVRQDRRLDRSATDSAVLGAAAFLNPQSTGGLLPYVACRRAWEYLSNTLSTASTPFLTPPNACSDFPSNAAAAATYCAAASPLEIDDNQTVDGRTVRIAWPIPQSGGTGFLNPDLAPGAVQQTFSSSHDGINGCDRIGAAIFESPTFLLGSALGSSGTNIQVHSVARFNPNGGPQAEVAALNVLNPHDCSALKVGGGGHAVVGPTLDASVTPTSVVGPGIVAVESDGNGTCGGMATTTITLNGVGTSACAAASQLNSGGTNCDGKGIIRSHALDPGGQNAYNPADTLNGTLKPVPVPEDGHYGWNPVTSLYGCATICGTSGPSPNYIEALVGAYGNLGDPAPASPYLGTLPYPNTSLPPSFIDISAQVGCTSKPPSVPPGLPTFPVGNYFINCDLNITSASVTLAFAGGTVVVNGGLNLTKGCLVVNTTDTTCSKKTWQGAGTANVTTQPAPKDDAMLYLRGNGFQDSATLVMPQTFVYQAATATSLNIQTTQPTLWTAPGAGAVDSSGHTTLETACTSAAGLLSQDCMNSRFARIAYWSEYAAPKSSPDNFQGQGALSLTGVFFTPTAYLKLAGGSGYTAASAQFWADKLEINGGGTLVLSPDTRTAIKTPTGSVALIR